MSSSILYHFFFSLIQFDLRRNVPRSMTTKSSKRHHDRSDIALTLVLVNLMRSVKKFNVSHWVRLGHILVRMVESSAHLALLSVIPAAECDMRKTRSSTSVLGHNFFSSYYL